MLLATRLTQTVKHVSMAFLPAEPSVSLLGYTSFAQTFGHVFGYLGSDTSRMTEAIVGSG